MTDTPVTDAPVEVPAPFGWSATNPQGGTTLFKGAAPPTSLGYTNVVEFDTFDAYHAAEQAMMVALHASVPAVISRRQFYQQLAIQGEITEDEAFAATAAGTIPPEMMTFVNALPTADQFGAKMKLMSDSFFRSDALVATFGQAKGWTSDQLDALWSAAARL